MVYQIQDSVGAGGKNHQGDVLLVQELLNHQIAFGMLSDGQPLKLSGKADTPTVKTIRLFQERIVIQKPDGRVDPNGRTWPQLIEPPNKLQVRAEAIALSGLARFFGPVGDIDQELWDVAMKSLFDHSGDDRLRNPRIVTLVDFRLPKTTERLWVVNLQKRTILHHELVCHGKGSGSSAVPTSFSNRSGSNQSCVGAFITRYSWPSTLGGVNGRAMGLWGLDKTNAAAQARGIHFHGAKYVNPGNVGQSHGCFGTRPTVNETLVDLIQQGHFVYAYGGKSWL